MDPDAIISIFIARHSNSNSVHLSVRPSVRLSHSVIVSKRLNMTSYFLRHMVA